MKQSITQHITQVVAHRRLFAVLLFLLLFSVAVIIYIAATLEASDLRVITHYTAFGATHFYRDSWMYFLSFIGFIAVTAVCAIGMAIKLLLQDRESLAILIGWIGVVMVAITAVTYVHLAELL